MSVLSFKTFCIEYYAEHIGQPSQAIYQLLNKEGILDMLKEDYEDLHGMGMEYLMQLFDEYLGGDVK